MSYYAVGIMLAQNLDNIIDRPIYYPNQLMTSAKNNYSTTKKGSTCHDVCYQEKSTLLY
jgi:hypothetical protein